MSIASVESSFLTLESTYVIELINTYKARIEANYKMLLEGLAHLFLHLVFRIHILEPQRNENNTARVGSCPAAMPFSLAEAGAFMFSTTIMEQRDRLAVTFVEEEIDSIEVQFKVFLRKYHNDEDFKHLVEITSKCETFVAAWSWFYKEYPLLVQPTPYCNTCFTFGGIFYKMLKNFIIVIFSQEDFELHFNRIYFLFHKGNSKAVPMFHYGG